MRKDVQDRRSDVQITPRTFWEPALYAAPFLLVCMTFVNEVFVLWNSEPGPARSLYTVVFYIYESFFVNWKIGLASASALVLFGIVFILTLVQLFVQKKLVFYK